MGVAELQTDTWAGRHRQAGSQANRDTGGQTGRRTCLISMKSKQAGRAGRQKHRWTDGQADLFDLYEGQRVEASNRTREGQHVESLHYRLELEEGKRGRQTVKIHSSVCTGYKKRYICLVGKHYCAWHAKK